MPVQNLFPGADIIAQSDTWVGSGNPLGLLDLYDATGNTAYLAKAQEFFTQLDGGTYDRNGDLHTTASFIALIEAARSAGSINLRSNEFAPLAIAADRAGASLAQKDAFNLALTNSIDSMVLGETAGPYYDVVGLAKGVRGLATLGIDYNPTAGLFASASSTSDLADELAQLQTPSVARIIHQRPRAVPLTTSLAQSKPTRPSKGRSRGRRFSHSGSLAEVAHE